MPARNPCVFLSRAWSDHQEAGEIINKLKEYGIELKEDVRNAPYKNRLPELAETASDSDCVVALLSARYLQSLNCVKEIVRLRKIRNAPEKTIFVLLPDAKPALKTKGAKYYADYWKTEKEKLEKDKRNAPSENVRENIDRALREAEEVLLSVEKFFADINKNNVEFDRLKINYEPIIRVIGRANPELTQKAERKLNLEEIVRNEQKRLRIIARNKIRSLRKRSFDKLTVEKTGILEIPLKTFAAKEGANRDYEEVAHTLEEIADSREPVIIFGRAGQGKTILSTVIAEKALDSKERIPYFARVEDIVARSKTSDALEIILSRNSVGDLSPKTLEKTRFCFIIDDCHKLGPEDEKKMGETADLLNEKGHHVALFSDFNARFPDPLKAPAPGYKTIIIDSEKIADPKSTDRFIETRFGDPKERRQLKAAVRKYDETTRGSRQNPLLLTSILSVRNKRPQTFRKLVGDARALKKILNGEPLSKFELYGVFIDCVLGAKSKQSGKFTKDKREKLAQKAFNDIFDPENSSAKGLKSSSLLYKSGKELEFVHDSLREFFLAEYFIGRINLGKLSIRKAYEDYWTYVEDSRLWGLPEDKEWRALLPDWEATLAMIAEKLTPEKTKDLIRVIEENYNEIDELRAKGKYNPFAEDKNIALRLAGGSSRPAKKTARKSASKLSRAFPKTAGPFSGAARREPESIDPIQSRRDYFKLKTARILGELGHYDPKLSRLLKDENWEVRKSAADALGKIGRHDPQLIKLLRDKNFYVRKSAARALGKIKRYDPELAEFLKDENPETRWRAANILGEIKRYNPELSTLFEDENAYVRWSAVDALGKMKRYDPKITTALKDENIGVRQRAADALKEIADKKIIEDYQKLYGSEERVMESFVLRDIHQAIKPSGLNPF